MKIILMMAITLDGKIAKNSDHFPDWTGSADKKLFARVSKEAGLIIMGEKTFKTFPAPLKERLNVVFTLEPNPVDIPGVKWVSGDPLKVVNELEVMGYTSAILGGGATINTLFLKNNLVDEIIITIAPKIFGQGIDLFNEAFDINLDLIDFEKIDEKTLKLHYKIIK